MPDGVDPRVVVAALPPGWRPLEPDAPPRARRIALFTEVEASGWDAALAALARRVDAAVLAAGAAPGGLDWRVRPLEGEAETAEEDGGCLRLGRFRVWPVMDHRPPPPGAIRLRTGWAFGSGRHPSTRAAAAALEWLADRGRVEGREVLDVGAGTGILAVLAVRMGAAAVTAVDTDPEAVALAAENLRLNGASARAEVRDVSLERLPAAAFDLATANLVPSVLVRLAPHIRRCLRPGGRLVAAGFTAPGARAVESALRRAGFSWEHTVAVAGWEGRVYAGAKGADTGLRGPGEEGA
nr:50S ribosomal protein L11 methyltransferase [Dissulfurirhabdus thermomarina]